MPERSAATANEPAIELSVVIAARDAAATIAEQLHALLGQTWSGTWEVVVADNGSTDDTVAVVGRAAAGDPRVRVVDASGGVGAGHARNVGVRAARGASLAFCDADDVVGGGWVAAMGDGLRAHSCVTGPQDDEALNPPSLHGVFGTRRGYELQRFEGIFPFGPTATLGVRREAFERVGGFDTGLLVGQDVDLCLRLWLAGEQLAFVDAAVVHYRFRGDLRSLGRRARQYGSAAPAIARRLADAGRPTPSRWSGVRRWLWLVRHLPSTRTEHGRARWVVVAAGCAGRLSGSLRHRWLLL